MLWPHQAVNNYSRALFEAINAGQDIIDEHEDKILEVVKRAQGQTQDEPGNQAPEPTDPEVITVLQAISEQFSSLAQDENWESVAESSIVPVVDSVNTGFERAVERVAGVQPTRNNQMLQDFIDDKIDDQVDLIKTLPERHFQEIKETVSKAVNEGWSTSRLKEEIPRAGATARFNAERIARDQVGTVSGELTEQRHKQAGFNRFVWMTVGDSRVRDTHRARNGVKFPWNGKPDGEAPGEPIQCRCVAQVVVEEIQKSYGLQVAA